MTDKPLPRREAWLLARRKKRRRVLLWQVGLLLALFGLWQLTTSTGLSDGFLVSSPSRMWGTFLSLCRGGELLRHIGTSCLETAFWPGRCWAPPWPSACGGGTGWPGC